MAESRRAARPSRLESRAGVVPQARAPDAASSDSNLTYASIPRPARSAAAATPRPAHARLPVATKRIDVDSAAAAGEVSIESLVTADRSLSATFSKERVESWRATVEASQNLLDLSFDGDTSSHTPRHAGKRSPGPVTPADEANPAFSEGTPKARQIRTQDSPERRKKMGASRQVRASQETTARAGGQSWPDEEHNELGERDARPGLPLNDGTRAERARFGRDRTNESIDRESADGSALSAVSSTDSTPRKRRRKPQKRVRIPKKSKASQQKDESDNDTEERKQRARAKWAAIDSYAMETVYTL